MFFGRVAPSERSQMAVQHILVIDDDISLLEMYRYLLEEEGYRVSLSNTTFESARDVERLHPDLLLLDVKINAQEDGLLQLEQLHSYSPTRSLPVILCTAASAKRTHERVEALRQQGVPVVYKPFDIYELLRVVQDALRSQRAEQNTRRGTRENVGRKRDLGQAC